MAYATKKPIRIEYVQFHYKELADNPLTFDELPNWLIQAIEDKKIKPEFRTEDYWYLIINTLEGEMLVSPGDYIVRGIYGELYPVKPEIFKKTYDIEEQ